MPRSIVLFIIFLLLVVGGLYFFSTLPKEQPVKTVEVEVTQGQDAK